MLSHKLIKAAHTVTILSQLPKTVSNDSSLILFTVLIGIIPFNMVYRLFNRLITCSMCIQTEEVFRDVSTLSVLS